MSLVSVNPDEPRAKSIPCVSFILDLADVGELFLFKDRILSRPNHSAGVDEFQH